MGRADVPHEDPGSHGTTTAPAVSQAIRDQDDLWRRFLAMARAVVDSLEKGVEAICDGRLDLVPDVKAAERESDLEEVRIEWECLRILARYEPVASDLRRLATILKVNRDCERIADLAARLARRARKLARKSPGVALPEALASMAREVLALVRETYDALAGRDAAAGPGDHRRRPVDRPGLPTAPQAAQGGDPPRHVATRRLAPVARHGAEPRADRRPRHRDRADDRLPRGRDVD